MNLFSTEHFMLPWNWTAENTSVYILWDSKSFIVKFMNTIYEIYRYICVLSRIVFLILVFVASFSYMKFKFNHTVI